MPKTTHHIDQLHTTTSPLYAISASNDISAAMCDHGSGTFYVSTHTYMNLTPPSLFGITLTTKTTGKSLTDECIREAVAFRQSLMRAYREITKDSSAQPLPHVGSSNSLPALVPAPKPTDGGGNGGGDAATTGLAESNSRATRSHGLPPASAAAAAAAGGGKKGGGKGKESGLTKARWVVCVLRCRPFLVPFYFV